MVFHQRIRMEDIGADLAAPFDLLHLALDVGHLFLTLALAQLDELRAQHAHTVFTVMHLVAARLRGDDDARRKVRHTHGGAGLVDVLSARAAGVIGIHADILHIDFDFVVVVVDNRRNIQRGEARLAARVGIKRADAHQAMHALFAAQEAVGVFTVHLKGYGLEARLVAVEHIDELDGEAVAFAVTGVHAVKHERPILRFRSARTRVQRKVAVVAVVVAAQQAFQSKLFQIALQLFDFLARLGQQVGILHFLGKLHGGIHIVGALAELFIMLHFIFGDAHLPADLGRALEVVPEIRLVHRLVQLKQLLLQAGDVKVTHLPQQCFRGFVPSAGDRDPVRSR